MSFWTAVATFFTEVGKAWTASTTLAKINYVMTAVTLAVGVKGFMQARQMLAKGQDIMANKTSAGGKIPVIYGTRRVGAQVIYMDVSANDSRDLYVVYALSVGECEEIIGRSIELDGNALTDSARFKDGGYIGSDKISSGSGSLNTVTQNGTGINAGAGGFGTDPTARYRYVFNLHHGAASQTADPMLVASMPNWTSLHRLDGVCYIAAHYGYDKEGMWRGVPQLTVQVRGKKVFDPRDSNQTFGTVSTYEHSDNPALCFLDYITNNEYGKGLTESQINMSTFSSAANVCDIQVDQPYFNGTAQSVTWNGNSGDSFINITGTGANTVWWQNKIGELMDLQDGSSNVVLDGAQITEVKRDEFYDVNAAYAVYFNNTLASNYSSQNGTSLLKVKRFHCNGYVDVNKNVMDNAKELLANMRGIFLYINGKYELSIEDTGSSTFSITDNHIISDSGISVDYGNKDKKANKVIVEFFNANKKYELDTATVLHDASPNYTSDDGGEVLEVKAEFPYVSDPYIAYNMAKAILTRSRNQTTMQFVGTPEMYKLNVGDIVDLTYAGLGFNGKICRVEALELQSNGLVAVSLIEYFDVYTWEVPPQEPLEELANLPSAYAVKAPTGLSFTDSASSPTARPFLSWNEPTDFPDHQYRVNVVDSSSNQLTNQIVDTEKADLNYLPKGTNYVASVSSINTLGVESSPATLTFSIGDQPVATADLQDGSILEAKLADDAVTRNKILDDAVNSLKLADDAVTNAKIAVDAIQGDVIAAGAITEVKIGTDAVTAPKIEAGAIIAGKLAVDSIVASNIQADAVTSVKILAGTIVASNIATGTLTSASGVFGTISANDITAGTLSTSRLNVADIISTGSIIVSGSNISNLTNNSAYVNAAGASAAAPVQSVAGSTGAVSAATIISAGSIVVQGDNISTLTNNSAFINGGQVNGNVTSISGGVITTGTVNADRINIDNVTLDTSGGQLIIASNGVTTTQIATRAVGAQKAAGSAGTTAFGDGRSSDNFSTIHSFSFTTADAGVYLIQASCMVGGQFNSTTRLESRTRVGGTVVSDYLSPIGEAAIQPIIQAGVITLTAATTYTVDFQGQVEQDNPPAGEPVDVGGFASSLSIIKLAKQ